MNKEAQKIMEVAEAIELLLENGYKRDISSTEQEQYFYKRISGSDCMCNERPPSIGVTIYDIPHNRERYISMDINLRAEAVNRQWTNIGYYSCNLSELSELSTYEYIISKMWECAN